MGAGGREQKRWDLVTNCEEKTKNHGGSAIMTSLKIAAIHELHIRIVGRGFSVYF